MSKPNEQIYDYLAGLFYYPTPEYGRFVARAESQIAMQYPEAGREIREFAAIIGGLSQKEREELFTRTFDVQAITTLDLGYVLFGDDYKRGAMLVNLSREHREAGVDCGHELADHLPNMLRLISRLKKPDLCEELVQKIIAPALLKVLSEFDPERFQLKTSIYKKHHRTLIQHSPDFGVAYQYPLRAVYRILDADFQLKEYVMPGPSAGFLKSIGSELTIEAL